ncbi:GNAT family N-acetyltransferase [Brevibacterium spongiae]|uniref:GNAT family N-acetyltransferase n=1 Tax=Brevibacterium spongiae TaxID=2909672 RepID=A0ABY5SS81_9MICO|nr:GNAT family N-acetyltransferase [Brevibacterium spongiae]UVI37180.1 GNAT family N-acetyltransferase [Brevibacterium spongiae]
MEITHIPAGSRGAADIDEILAEVIDFDALINRASGLGSDFDPLPAEVRGQLLDPGEYTTTETWIARRGGTIVAKGIAWLSLRDNLDVAEIWCAVDPRHRRRGLGSRLLEHMEDSLRDRGRTRLTSFCDIPPSARDAEPRGGHIAADSGSGSLPTDLPEVSFLTSHGFAFKQLERCSVAQTGTAASMIAGELAPGYSIETWHGPTPSDRRKQIALLHQRMSTDAPGSAEFGTEEAWDAARVRALDEQRAAKGERMHTALALRGESAAGFTEIAHFDDRPEIGWQGATLVAADHRGHGLGAALKIANHRSLTESSGVERVYTWNAVENRWMLAINDRAGFATWAWVGLWTKSLHWERLARLDRML